MIHSSGGVLWTSGAEKLWRVLERVCATVAFKEYKGVLRKGRWVLRHHPDVMLLADRGNARP